MRTGAVRNGVTMRTACASGRRRSGSSSRDMASCVGRAEPSTSGQHVLADSGRRATAREAELESALHLGSIKENAPRT